MKIKVQFTKKASGSIEVRTTVAEPHDYPTRFVFDNTFGFPDDDFDLTHRVSNFTEDVFPNAAGAETASKALVNTLERAYEEWLSIHVPDDYETIIGEGGVK